MAKENHFEDIYDVVRLVPKGMVTTYGAIAEYLGLKGGARMVGWAMNAAIGKDVPAHRVVNRQGLLTGKMHFSHPDQMELLLKSEGIEIKNDQVVNFDNKLWKPIEHLAI